VIGLILTDPPLRAIKTFQKNIKSPTAVYTPAETVVISPRLFQNGYVDFMPHSVQMATLVGPPRISMLDDLCFYLQQHSSHINSGSNSGVEVVAAFTKKIVAAHYQQLLSFVGSVVSEVQFHMSRMDRSAGMMGYLDAVVVEAGQWSDTQALERRTSEYITDIEGIMMQCGIPLVDHPDVSSCAARSSKAGITAQNPWDDSTADFQVLHIQLVNLRRRAEHLNTSIAGLASMSGNQQALREAQSTKALTLVGLVFIPLAYTATLFSMTEPFAPGGERFWLYFAVSLPLILCVLGMYTAVDAYGAEKDSPFRRFVLRALHRFRYTSAEDEYLGGPSIYRVPGPKMQ
jgi:hypothetical protein